MKKPQSNKKKVDLDMASHINKAKSDENKLSQKQTPLNAGIVSGKGQSSAEAGLSSAEMIQGGTLSNSQVLQLMQQPGTVLQRSENEESNANKAIEQVKNNDVSNAAAQEQDSQAQEVNEMNKNSNSLAENDDNYALAA